jgi:chemosensory pili system protein ChpA (sensor histidine kinase/response regulator)
MPEGEDRAALLDVFRREAWQTLWTLAAGARQLLTQKTVGGAVYDDLRLFAHRLRGSAALYGFPGLSELTGLIEDALPRLPRTTPEECRTTAALLAAFVETLRTVLKKIEADGVEDLAAIAAFRARHAAALEKPAPHAAAAAALVHGLERFFSAHGDIPGYFLSEAGEHLDTITRTLDALERGGPDPDAVPALLRTLHTLKGAAYTVGCASVGDLTHRVENLVVGVREGQVAMSPAVVEGVAAGVTALRAMVATDASAPDRLAALLEQTLAALHKPVSLTAAKSEYVRPPQGGDDDSARTVRPTVRVPVDCLDSLANLVGEFVVAKSRLERHLKDMTRVEDLLSASTARMTRLVQTFELEHEYMPVGAPAPALSRGAAEREDHRSITELFEELEFDRYSDLNVLARSVREISADLSEIRAQLGSALREIEQDTSGSLRLVQGLRGEVTRARMVPVGRLFARFPRQVRQASRAAGKAVALNVSGTSVEIDSAIIEEIADPLLHLVQNAVVHGIETEEQRQAAGKPAQGTVYLRAYHENGAVFVEVEDNGRGIDVDALRAHAVARGLVTAEASPLLSEHEMLNLMFLPGFTTAGEVTAAAGRGIGLDVVRANVARINGDVEVTTQRGMGTLFRIRIPLTVLISDALLVEAGGAVFAIPLNAVKMVVKIPPERIESTGDKETVWLRDELVDLIRLDRYLELSPTERVGEIPVLLLRSGGRSLAVAVDQLLGKDELVIKTLGGFPQGVGPFSSGSVSAEGHVILVLNPTRLLQATGLTPVPGVAVREPDRERPDERRPRAERRRFLLVDDSISVRKFVGQMLERSGFDVVTASNGGEALQCIETTSIHAVITDLEMPNGNGYELIENLRRRPSTRELPIVILTTRSGEKHQELARRLGVEHYLTKPVDEAEFIALMSALVARPLVAAGADGGG